MAFYKTEHIDILDLNPKIAASLKKAHLTSQKQILTLSNAEVSRLSSLGNKDVQTLKDLIAERLAPRKPVSALELARGQADPCLQHWKMSTGCEVMDKMLRGGFLSGLITEISGESACGKTQLCLQLCISAQLNRVNSGGAVYICTEDVFPSKRLQQFIQSYSGLGTGLGDKIFIEHVADFETLDFCINKKLPTLLKRGQVRLVVIDSVTALFRCHYDVTQTVQRAKHLTSFASLLRQLAFQYNIPVVCVNQVSASMTVQRSHDSHSVPALGLTWANQIACRITLSRLPSLPPSVQRHKEEWGMKQTGLSEPTYRSLNVVFAPHLPQSHLVIFIDHCGVHGLAADGSS